MYYTCCTCSCFSICLTIESAHAPAQSRGAPYLFFGDSHVVFDIREDGGMDEQTSVLHRTASALQRRPLLLPTVHQLQDLIKLMPVDLTQQQKHINSLHTRRESTQKFKWGTHLRPVWGLWLQRVSDRYILGSFHTETHKLVINRLFHVDAWRSGARLTLVKERALLRLLHRRLHCTHTHTLYTAHWLFSHALMLCLFLQCIMQRCILFMLRFFCKHDNIMHHIITPFLEFNELCIGVNLGLCADVNMHKNRRMWSSEFTAARVVWSIATSPGLNKLQPKKPLRNTTRTTIKWTLIIQYTLLHYSYVYCIWPLNPVNPTVPQYCVKVH